MILLGAPGYFKKRSFAPIICPCAGRAGQLGQEVPCLHQIAKRENPKGTLTGFRSRYGKYPANREGMPLWIYESRPEHIRAPRQKANPSWELLVDSADHGARLRAPLCQHPDQLLVVMAEEIGSLYEQCQPQAKR